MLNLNPDTIAWIILKAREYDGKEADASDRDPRYDDTGDDDPNAVLEDRADDPTEAELRSWIADLTDTEQAELVALYWLGRGDGDAEDFADLVDQARASRTTPTADYLLGAPMLGDMLEAGMDALGYDIPRLESDIL